MRSIYALRARYTLLSLFIFVAVISALIAWITAGERERRAVLACEGIRGEVEYGLGAEAHSSANTYLRRFLPREYYEDVTGVTLCFYSSNLPPDTTKWLSDLPSLRIVLIEVPNAGESFRHLQHLRHLESLLVYGRVTDEDLFYLRDMTSIVELECPLDSVTSVGYSHLSTLVGLESITFCGSSIADDDLAMLSDLKRLRDVNLAITGITDEGVRNLECFPMIRTLILDETKVTDRCIEILAQFGDLQVLSMSGIPLSDESLTHFDRLIHLHTLDLRGTDCTSEGIGQLRKDHPTWHILGPSDLNEPTIALPRQVERRASRK